MGLLDQEFAKECDTNYALLNPVIAENIDMKKCDEGQVILRLVQLAKEKNVDYIPSSTSAQAMHAYCLRKGIPPPGGVGVDAPVYAPMPDPMIVNIEMQGGQVPPGYPNPGPGAGGMPPPQNPGYGGGAPGGGAPLGQPPAYQP